MPKALIGDFVADFVNRLFMNTVLTSETGGIEIFRNGVRYFE